MNPVVLARIPVYLRHMLRADRDRVVFARCAPAWIDRCTERSPALWRKRLPATRHGRPVARGHRLSAGLARRCTTHPTGHSPNDRALPHSRDAARRAHVRPYLTTRRPSAPASTWSNSRLSPSASYVHPLSLASAKLADRADRVRATLTGPTPLAQCATGAARRHCEDRRSD